MVLWFAKLLSGCQSWCWQDKLSVDSLLWGILAQYQIALWMPATQEAPKAKNTTEVQSRPSTLTSNIVTAL